MDPITLILTVALAFVLWKVLFNKNSRSSLINKIPGPDGYPIIGNLLMALGPREEIMTRFIENFNKYGSIFKTWLGSHPTVHLADPTYIETILSNNKFTTKGRLYTFLYPWLGTGLLTSDGQKWFTHRKMITPTFHFKILDTFLDVYSQNSKILVKKLEGKAKTGEVVDIYPFITLCALDIICETAMGTKVKAQDSVQSPYVASIYRISTLTIQRSLRMWLHPDFIYYKTPGGKEYLKNLEVVQGFTKRVIQERKEERKNRAKEIKNTENDDIGSKRKQAFLDLLLEASESDQSNKLTDVELREEVDTFMFEGHDTTTAGVSWAILLLGHHPKIQEEVYEEVKSIFESDPDRTPTMNDLNEMKVLERVIKETLRLFPSVPFIQRKLPEDVQFGEYTAPKDTTANIVIFNLHRNPKIYPNPQVFDPNRFLPENIQKRHPYSYIPFSAGSRNCIGQKFALLEEKVILSTLIYNYKFESVGKFEDLIMMSELVLRPKTGVQVKITKRT